VYIGNKIHETMYSLVIVLFRSLIVGIETRLRVRRSGARIPAGARDFSLLQIGPGAHPASDAYRGYFPEIKRPGYDVEHSPPSNAEVKNKWTYASTPLHGVDRDNFYYTPTSNGILYRNYCKLCNEENLVVS
jgi:hypothetical protein